MLGYWDYFEILGGWLLMIVCIGGNFGAAYLRGYKESIFGTVKRMLLFWLVTTLVFCFFFIREAVEKQVVELAFLMPLKGLVVTHLGVLAYVLISRHRLAASRLLSIEPRSRWALTYEKEALILLVGHVAVIVGLVSVTL